MSSAPRSALEQSWIDNAAGWIEAVRKDCIESRTLVTNAAMIDAVINSPDTSSPRRILDMGCGEGWLLRELGARGIDAVGVEASAPLAEAARAEGNRVFQLSYADITALPAQAGSDYAAVVFNFSLFDQDLAPLLKAVGHLLKEEGHLLIQTLHPGTAPGKQDSVNGWRTETFEQFGGAFPSPMPWYFRTLTSWINLLRESGYRIRDIQEPAHPRTGLPASLLLICERASS